MGHVVCLYTANTAAAAAGILFFMSFMPYYYLNSNYADTPHTTKLATSLLPNVAMGFAFNLIAYREGDG